MATCGYVCPSCEGKGFLDDGTPCEWCQPIIDKTMGEEDNNVATLGIEKE